VCSAALLFSAAEASKQGTNSQTRSPARPGMQTVTHLLRPPDRAPMVLMAPATNCCCCFHCAPDIDAAWSMMKHTDTTQLACARVAPCVASTSASTPSPTVIRCVPALHGMRTATSYTWCWYEPRHRHEDLLCTPALAQRFNAKREVNSNFAPCELAACLWAAAELAASYWASY